jgi:peptidyl-prolyl cis-trans isomerase B (cyclophilin B)
MAKTTLKSSTPVKAKAPVKAKTPVKVTTKIMTKTISNFPTARIETSLGNFEVELWKDVAPKHAANFLKLAKSGFYNGLIFHRILAGFVIQGGCPDGDGTGGPGWEVEAEFNNRRHEAGVLSMARSADPNSAGSQFFVCLTRDGCKHLDGQYTAFGKVTSGMDTVEKLGALACDRNGMPKNPPKMVRVSVT